MTARRKSSPVCVCCGATRTDRDYHHSARDLCLRCYKAPRPRPHEYRWRADVFEDWRILESSGLTRRLAAERIGVSYDALCKAIARTAS